MQIRAIDGMSAEQLRFEIQRGGKFVLYHYCVSLLVVTLRRSSDVYFIREGENAVVKGLPWTLLTLTLGWWGIPWGPIYTVSSVVVNLKGGKDVTSNIVPHLQAGAVQGAAGALA